MTGDLSLLFKLRGDNSQLKSTVTDSRAAVNSLKQTLGPELAHAASLSNKAFTEIGNTLNGFVAQRIPLVGGAIVQITDKLKGFGGESAKTEKAVSTLSRSIQSMATQSGKSIPQVSAFLSRFVQLEGQAKRNDAAFHFFGGSVDVIGNKTAKFIPELEDASGALAAVTTESAGAGAAIASMAGPIGIAVIALAAMAGGIVLVTKELIDLTKKTADFQGRMYDLAQQTGLAVETLSALEVAAKKTGGEVGGSVLQSIVAFQRKLEEAQNPLSKTAELFRKFNVDTSDTETALRQTLAALAAMPEGFSQTNAAAELFGARGGKQVLAILKETGGDLDTLIKQMREAGILITTDAARSADILNDELALLDFQMRAAGADLAKELIPALVEMARASIEILQALRPLLPVLSSLLRSALSPLGPILKAISIQVRLLTFDFKGATNAIREWREELEKARDIPPIDIPGLAPVALPSKKSPEDAAREAAQQADAVVAIVKRQAAEQNQALSEAFERGRITREKQADETIATNKRIRDVEVSRLQALIDQKELERKALEHGTEDYKKTVDEIQKLQQQQLDAESLFETTSREIRARAAKERADSRRNEEQNSLDNLLRGFDRQITAIEAQIKREEITDEVGLTSIEAIEEAKINARRESLEQQKRIGFLTIEDQKDLNEQTRKVDDEAASLRDQQIARRLQRERDAAKRARELKLAEIDTVLELQRIVGERTIATIESLAAQRIKTEEDAAKEILRIRLGLIDQEIEATETKLKAAASIGDRDERIRAEAELNAQIKILKEQRKTIEADGNRAIDERHQEDLENERQYADELQDITDRITSIQRNAAEEVIRTMRLHFASRRDIIRARTQFDLDDEAARHEEAEREIRQRERENHESRRTELEKLDVEFELNRLREAEAERHRLAMQGIKDQGKRDEEKASPFGDFKLGTDDLKEFASVLESTIVPLGETLKNTFLQVADAIGQTVANWVLLGETGPAVMRKILAQALASIAAEAAVNAIKMAAVGFARLAMLDFAGAANAFVSSGLWASIAGVSAVAGRGVAGDLFKSKSGATGGDNGRTGSQGVGQLNPLALERSTQVVRHEHVVKIGVESNDSHIVGVIGRNFQEGGIIRELVLNDAVHGG